MTRTDGSDLAPATGRGGAAGLDALDRPARVVLVAFTVLTAVAVLALVGGASRTATSFAWTIEPPLAAAVLGAGYAAGCLLVVLALRAGRWAAARLPLATIAVFTGLTLVATLVHLDKLHLTRDEALPRGAAYLWLVVYVVVPVALVAVLVRGERHRGSARAERRLPRMLALALVAEGAVLAGLGLALFLAVGPVRTGWPWELTPFLSRVTGAWLTAFGLACLAGTRLSPAALRPCAAAYAAFGLAELGVLALHHGDLRPGPSLAGLLALLGAVAGTGLWGLRHTGGVRRTGATSGEAP